jgi:hypothetical protein
VDELALQLLLQRLVADEAEVLPLAAIVKLAELCFSGV